MIEQAKGALIHNGLSQDLLDMLQTIEESEARYEAGDSSLRSKRLYSQDAMYELRMSILCRNYGKSALWEYAHYITALQHYFPQGVLQLFWVDECTSANRLKSSLQQFQPELADRIEQGKLALTLSGGQTFTLHLHRINWVAAWTALLACIDPAFVAQLTKQNQLNSKNICEFCTYLKQKMDAYLEPRMQTIHAQRQGWALLSWLEAEEQELGDESVLQFWQNKAADEGDDFKRFKTVVAVAMTLQEAMRIYEQRQAEQFAQSHSQDSQGEDAAWRMDDALDGLIYSDAESANDIYDIDSDWSEATIDDGLYASLLEEKTALYSSRLSDGALSEIKFLTAKDGAFFTEYEAHALASLRLPLSYLRGQIFGDHQSRLTEAQRKKNAQRIEALMALEDLESYSGFRERLTDAMQKTQQTVDAALYSLLCAGEPDALAEVMTMLSDEQAMAVRASLASMVQGNVHAINFGKTASEQVGAVLEREAPKAWKRFELAFNKVNRAGFRALASEEEIPVYREGIRCLKGLMSELRRYQDVVEKQWPMDTDMQQCEQIDRQTFQSVYQSLYQHGQIESKGVGA